MKFAPIDYLDWARTVPTRARISLAASGLPLPEDRRTPWLDTGWPPLTAAVERVREQVAERMGVEPAGVLPAVGASMANFLAVAALVDPRDVVVVERPGYQPMVRLAETFGGRVVALDRWLDRGFAIDLDQAAGLIRDLRPRLVLLTNPANPSGTRLSSAELATIAGLLHDHGGLLLVDEAYLDLVAGPADSACRLGPNVLVSNSLTKSYGLSEVRCGWLAGPPAVVERVRRFSDLTYSSLPARAFARGSAALDHLPELRAIGRGFLGDAPARLHAWLAARPELEVVSDPDMVIAFPRLRAAAASPGAVDRFARRALDDEAVAIVPGRFFDAPDHFRISCTCGPTALTEALERLDRVLGSASAGS